ncbi:MAG: lytic murein transglycosylase [Alcaligenaceae bacterium]
MKKALSALALSCAAFATSAQTFDACVAGLRQAASAQGISASVLEQAFKAIEPDETVLKAFDFQPEFRTPIWDYVAGLVDDERVADGQAKLKEWSKTLAQAEQTYGVDRYTIVAVWGVESNFGRIQGTRELVRSLVTLVCANKRQAFFKGELLATLKIVQSGDIPLQNLVGSWAGAFGQTQFMPSTYQRIAVDFDADGKRDIVNSVPDALGSTANYLKLAGWVSGANWGYEVQLPKGYAGPTGRTSRQPLAQFAKLGVKPIKADQAVPGESTQAALLLPAGPTGPAFIVFRNFDAIYSYNAAESYALSIAHLADRLRGAGGFTTPWPTDDAGTSRAERREVQKRLADRGYDIGEIDGMIGTKSRLAISEFQNSIGVKPDGRAGQRVLQALRAANLVR